MVRHVAVPPACWHLGQHVHQGLAVCEPQLRTGDGGCGSEHQSKNCETGASGRTLERAGECHGGGATRLNLGQQNDWSKAFAAHDSKLPAGEAAGLVLLFEKL
eukprot:4972988-Prymnesium_polylepis.2